MSKHEHKHHHDHDDSHHGHEHHEHHHGDHHAHPDHHAHRHDLHVHGDVLTVRASSGLSGDMMLAGLARMAGVTQDDLDALLASLRLSALHGSVRLEPRSVNHVAGWGCAVTLPHEHEHRSLVDVRAIIAASDLDEKASALADACFVLLAEAEGAVHGKPADEVCFHEVGALDSIVDICLASALFARLAPARFVCSPLPMGEGGVHCAHGWIPTPAPAVLELLRDVPVCGFAGRGETVTPTAIALLKAFGADFGPWPAMRIRERALVYGTRVFDNAPNGSVWALGPAI